jgi:hypothetical protein
MDRAVEVFRVEMEENLSIIAYVGRFNNQTPTLKEKRVTR